MKKFTSFALGLLISLSIMCAPMENSSYSSPLIGISVSANQTAPAFPLPYQYRELNREEQKFYNAIRNAIIDCKQTVKVNGQLSDSGFQRVMEIIFNYDVYTFDAGKIEYSYYDTRTRSTDYEFKITYNNHYSKATYDKMLAEIDKVADRVISQFKPGMSQYARIKHIHDYIAQTTSYTLEGKNIDNAYGALVSRKAKCDGISHAFSYIAAKAGFTAVNVIYEPPRNQVGHMWNKIRFGNNWYVIDVTNNIDQFFNNSIRYDYFMISDSDFNKLFKEQARVKSPAATDSSRSYFHTQRLRADSVDAAKTLIRNEMLKTVRNKGTTFSIQCSSREVYNAAVRDLFGSNSEMFDIIDVVSERASVKLADTVNFVNNDPFYTIQVCIFYPNTSISMYFKEPKDIDAGTRQNLSQFGIK
ncbi:MAG: hypothetical protein FWG90_02275 [Oscillospiraceae bacterium]|nr:hypothetical protein [Oscillospiraceae bacterium]